MPNTAEFTTLRGLFQLVSVYLQTIAQGEHESPVSTKMLLPSGQEMSGREVCVLLSFLIEKEAPTHWRYTVDPSVGLRVYSEKLTNVLFSIKISCSETIHHNSAAELQTLANGPGQGVLFHIMQSSCIDEADKLYSEYARGFRPFSPSRDTQPPDETIVLFLLILRADHLAFIEYSPREPASIYNSANWTLL